MNPQDMLEKTHKHFAVECNNTAWDLIEREGELSEEETVALTHMVHASCFHWSQVGEPINMVRGHYSLSKVYFKTKNYDEATRWAENCWTHTETLGLDGWDLACGLEIKARACAAKNNAEGFKNYFEKAKSEFDKLEDKDDRELFEAELERGPWFDMRS